MEERYNPSSDWYQLREFGADKLTKTGRKVIKEANSYLDTSPPTNTLAHKAIEHARTRGTQFAASFTLGFSRIFNRLLVAKSSTSSPPTMEFDRSKLEATWPHSKSKNNAG